VLEAFIYETLMSQGTESLAKRGPTVEQSGIANSPESVVASAPRQYQRYSLRYRLNTVRACGSAASSGAATRTAV
jgi:hypothetical protein